MTIYGLIQASRLDHGDPKQHFAKYGYVPQKRTHGLWYHKTRKTTFTLVVDNFQICYFSKSNTDHLLDALEDISKIKTNRKGKIYWY